METPGTWPRSTSRCMTDDKPSRPTAVSPSSSGATTDSPCKRRCSFMTDPACLAVSEPCLTPGRRAMPPSAAAVARACISRSRGCRDPAGVANSSRSNGSPLTRKGRRQRSEGRRHEMIEQRQRHEQHDADAEAPADELVLDRQHRLILRAVQFVLELRLSHGASNLVNAVRRLACQRRRDATEEEPGDQQTDPDDETEQAEEIDRGELAESFLPQRLEV